MAVSVNQVPNSAFDESGSLATVVCLYICTGSRPDSISNVLFSHSFRSTSCVQLKSVHQVKGSVLRDALASDGKENVRAVLGSPFWTLENDMQTIAHEWVSLHP